MQLETYIKDLLYRYECVIVPGFGAFLTQYHSARVDSVSHTFYPPSKSVSFNRQLQTNDGLLANYLASATNSSYETSLSQLRTFTGSLSQKLNQGECIELNGLGEFQLNSEGSVQFIPSGLENFNSASFGLSSFISSEISRNEVATADLAAVSITPVREISDPLQKGEEKRSIPYMKYAAIGLLAIALTSLGGMKLYESNVQQHNFAEREKANALVESEIQEATFVLSDPLPVLKVFVPKQNGRYHIVAGAFRIEENAHKKIQQLIDKGFAPRLIGKNKYGLHQVVYSSFDERTSALRELSKIKRTENKDAWLLVKEL